MTAREIAETAIRTYGALQKPGELAWLLDQVLALGVENPSILEIGCDAGGTLWAWRQVSDDVTGITLQDGPFSTRRPLVDHGARISLGDSHRAATWVGVGVEFDVVFIDGDHSAVGAYADYSVACRVSRRLVALHDVAPHNPSTGCDVHQAWQFATRYPLSTTMTFAARVDEPLTWGGVGVARLR